jgi:hypothetical protein
MNTTYGESFPESGVAAIFPSRDAAHEAVRRLHESDIHGTWIGLIKPRTEDASTSRFATLPTGEPRVEAENWLARVFGEGDETLEDALERHGVGAVDTGVLGVIAPEAALLTVDAREATSDTVDILETCGGRVIAGRDTSFGGPIDPNSGATGDFAPAARDRAATTAPVGTVTTVSEDVFYYDPAYELEVGDPAAQRLQRPII